MADNTKMRKDTTMLNSEFYSHTITHFAITLRRNIVTDFIFGCQVSKWIKSSHKGTCQNCHPKKR